MSKSFYLTPNCQPMVTMVSDLDISAAMQNSSNATTVAVHQKSSNIWNHITHDYWQSEGTPNVLHLPLLSGGPIPVLAIMSLYLLFVIRVGPHLMRKRAALELRSPMLVYNSLMVVFNAYFFAKFISLSDYGRAFADFTFPSKYDNSPMTQQLIQTTYLYFLTKFVDLLDTVFFVLRKRDRQVTTLHLYHHTVVPLLAWLTMKLMPTVPAFRLFGILNSLVHTIMYSYYALSAFGPKIQPYLWWKRYITQIQITQFVVFIAYSLVLATRQTGYPATWFWIGFVQSPLFFYMFTDFYIQSYRKSKVSKTL